MRKAVIVITSSFLATEAIWHLYTAYRRYREKADNVSDNHTKKPSRSHMEMEDKIFDVMFFSNDTASCRLHMERTVFCEKTDCAVENLRRIVYYLDSATDTLDVCMFSFTCPTLAKAIINAHKRGVVVRMVMDENMAQVTGNQIKYFCKEGIKVRLKQLKALMHHKFVIIDNNILITGSTNWTMNAFFGNFENIIVTNELGLVIPFVNEFRRIWAMFNVTPIPKCN